MTSAASAFETITVEFENSAELEDFLANPDNQDIFNGAILSALNVFGGGLEDDGVIESLSLNYSKLVPGPFDAVAPPTEFPTLSQVKIEYVEQATEADILAFYDSLETAVTDAGGRALFTGNLDGDESGVALRFAGTFGDFVVAYDDEGAEGDVAPPPKATEVLSWSWGTTQSGTFNGSVEIGEFYFQFDGTSNPAVTLATLFSLYGGPFLTAEALESAAANYYMKLGDLDGESQGAIYGPDASGEYTVELATVEDASVPALRELFEQLLQETDASLI